LTAGGVGTLIFMPIVGALLRKVQARYLIAIGLFIQAAAAYHLSGINADLSFAHAAWARVFQAVGLPFLFVPINTIAYSGLPPGKSNDASALLNSMRNLGGSFGISFGTTLLARRGQFHHARLGELATPFARLRVPHVFPTTKALEAAVQQQAAVMSYIEIFWVLGLIAAVFIPLTFLLGRVKPGGEAAGH